MIEEGRRRAPKECERQTEQWHRLDMKNISLLEEANTQKPVPIYQTITPTLCPPTPLPVSHTTSATSLISYPSHDVLPLFLSSIPSQLPHLMHKTNHSSFDSQTLRQSPQPKYTDTKKTKGMQARESVKRTSNLPMPPPPQISSSHSHPLALALSPLPSLSSPHNPTYLHLDYPSACTPARSHPGKFFRYQDPHHL